METQTNTPVKKEKIKLDFKDSKYATGRRKKSIARVWLKKGSGLIYVNDIKMNEYFNTCCVHCFHKHETKIKISFHYLDAETSMCEHFILVNLVYLHSFLGATCNFFSGVRLKYQVECGALLTPQ